MRKFATVFHRSLLGLLVLLQIFFYPSIGFAEGETTSTDTTTPTSTSTTSTDPTTTTPTSTDPAPTSPTSPPPPTSTGPTAPTGADSQTYTYNSKTGLWENDYYTWDPVTHQTAPKTQPTYSYNPTTGMWDTTKWVYDAPSGKYVPNVVSSNVSPAPNDPLITNTGPNSTNNIGMNNTSNGTFNLFFNNRISNTTDSSATSGNASVLQNTTGGSALTGNANDVVNLLNLLQSSWDPNMSFSANVNGNQTGDLMLDPEKILNSGPNSQNGIDVNNNNNLDINIQANGQIVNNVDLTARSGNATVSSNTTGGDAKSGDANALANILNLVNSGIDSGKSFLGVININGNLDGDILLPEKLLVQLDTTGPNSLNTVTNNDNTTINATTVDNKSIVNNTDLNADSGQANVSGNTTGGSATTGKATTKLNVYNLTGRDIIGHNALLVFVNLKGQWTGLIFDAPAGTQAVLGTGPNSTNTINNDTNTNIDLDVDSNSQIVNNVTAHANSGDATVSRNTTGGDATTGNASATANIVNLINSKLTLDGWFGVLFINVMGTWNGSFGVNTAAGSPTTTAAAGNGSGVFGFNPTAASTATASGLSDNDNSVTTQVIGDTTSKPSTPAAPKTAAIPELRHQSVTPRKSSNAVLVMAVVFLLGLALLVGERLIALLQFAHRRLFTTTH